MKKAIKISDDEWEEIEKKVSDAMVRAGADEMRSIMDEETAAILIYWSMFKLRKA